MPLKVLPCVYIYMCIFISCPYEHVVMSIWACGHVPVSPRLFRRLVPEGVFQTSNSRGNLKNSRFPRHPWRRISPPSIFLTLLFYTSSILKPLPHLCYRALFSLGRLFSARRCVSKPRARDMLEVLSAVESALTLIKVQISHPRKCWLTSKDHWPAKVEPQDEMRNRGRKIAW